MRPAGAGTVLIASGAALVLMLASPVASAQPGAGPESRGAGPRSGATAPGGRFGGPPPSARESAQVDLTGYWVALVTEDWLWRMITAPRGDATSVSLNAEGRRGAAAWNREKDEADGEACRPFGRDGRRRASAAARACAAGGGQARRDGAHPAGAASE